PVLVVSGSMDPVGDYSKGVTQVAEDLKATGHDVTLKLFDGDRHEILNETNRDEVEDYIAAWADAALENGAKKAE
ncbi:MAG: alpha/beta hydrolase, partial [Acutalibacteraceae bacterium]|nr:alpha/beta hydrolase [Acutalibacteraceae bacterium]